jgi:hypothetical protein
MGGMICHHNEASASERAMSVGGFSCQRKGSALAALASDSPRWVALPSFVGALSDDHGKRGRPSGRMCDPGGAGVHLDSGEREEEKSTGEKKGREDHLDRGKRSSGGNEGSGTSR